MIRRVYTCRQIVVAVNCVARRCYTAAHEGPCHQPVRRSGSAGSAICPGPGARSGTGVDPGGSRRHQLRRHHVGARRISRNPEAAAGGGTRILRNPDERRAARHGLHPVGRVCGTRCRLHRNCCGQSCEEWSAEEGAAFPVNYFTAYFAYWKAGLLESAAGKAAPRVLIHAVAGGVGTAAVQIGKLLGIEMYGTSSSEEKLARVKTLGLQHGINYKQRDYEEAIKEMTHGEGVDAVFEMLGGEHTAKSVRCLRDFGRVIVYGAATGQPAHAGCAHPLCKRRERAWLVADLSVRRIAS